MSTKVIGIDPGPTPGLVVLHCAGSAIVDREVAQCSAGLLHVVLFSLAPSNIRDLRIGVEKFVARGRQTAEQQLTQDMVANVCRLFPDVTTTRTASQVKQWATDERLEAAGLLDLVKGMRHAKDAARHALFTAVSDGLIPDPLSRKATR